MSPIVRLSFFFFNVSPFSSSIVLFQSTVNVEHSSTVHLGEYHGL